MATKRTAKRDCEKGDCGTTTCRACALRVLRERVQEARNAVASLGDSAPERGRVTLLPRAYHTATLLQVEALLSDALDALPTPAVAAGR
ncbi:hypothetical protein [Corallococcus silvisoli]|uniref:hypothetical protein n=1 Tax=Corallococcus silvisoli TaxID=2697031 RepID=UPI0013767719|nr:hypothetical protein [Corallococcus silvisoli]NBD11839.1 hypothetical protein [Corallococcus silvisoli]